MELTPYGTGLNKDLRQFRCHSCLTRESIRKGSFLSKTTQTLQEFVRVVFYYFVKGFDADLALREMTENTEAKAGIHQSSAQQLYVLTRDRISRYQCHSVESKKFGGQNQEVMIDFVKLHLKRKEHQIDEYVVLGFIEVESGRMRAY